MGPKEIDGLLVPPGKAYTPLTGHLITGQPLGSELAQETWFQVKLSKHLGLCGLLTLSNVDAGETAPTPVTTVLSLQNLMDANEFLVLFNVI